MDIKYICLNILSFVFVSILLFFGAFNEFKRGNKFIAIITAIIGVFMIWKMVENLKNKNGIYTL